MASRTNVCVLLMVAFLGLGLRGLQAQTCRPVISSGLECTPDGTELLILTPDGGPVLCEATMVTCEVPDGMGGCTTMDCLGYIERPTWFLSAFSDSCDDVCLGVGACNAEADSLVNSEDRIQAIADLFSLTCAVFVPTPSEFAPGFQTDLNRCGYPTTESNTCGAGAGTVQRFCCCGTTADCSLAFGIFPTRCLSNNLPDGMAGLIRTQRQPKVSEKMERIDCGPLLYVIGLDKGVRAVPQTDCAGERLLRRATCNTHGQANFVPYRSRRRKSRVVRLALYSGGPDCDSGDPIALTRQTLDSGPSSGGNATETERDAMRRALVLARLAQGRTRPNPIVGCVVLERVSGEVLGEGYHHRAGQPHAEVNALRDCVHRGNAHRIAGATAVVTLEPCNHFGRTPPCSQALINANIGRVVIGMIDPDPRTAGRGAQALRDAGIQVVTNVEQALCEDANEAFSHRIRTGLPFGVLKYAMTLDGRTACDSGSSKWISGVQARGTVQQIRAGSDAIIVGGNTVRTDDPSLTLRDEKGCDVLRDKAELPLRVVLSAKLELPLDSKVFDTSVAATAVFCLAARAESGRVEQLRRKGVVVHTLENDHTILPLDVMKVLSEKHDCMQVLWECGGSLAAAAVRSHCVQKVHAFVAPKIVGGTLYSPLAGIGTERMDDALNLRRVSTSVLDNGDVMISGYL
ncbi:Riboflavin biosynthesis protein RibD [Porphyridium purpureum]|uniref:Riboflavin biosynthesis protein RibD n=1 Tax=Porphyridium purpureum TaxID=35688 RepID=A0A5J4Z2J9_PORPP|nr:Riboflavin biosynthesis protein RibD [Porphyridium purpureum]|eukprot:POR6653..scf295_1